MSHAPRYFPNNINNDAPLSAQADPHEERLAALQTVVTQCPPSQTPPSGPWKQSGLYAGPTSTAYLFHRLSRISPSLTLNGKTMQEWCLAYLERPSRSTTQHHKNKLPNQAVDASHCGIANETLALLAVTAAAKQDTHSLTEFLSFAGEILGEGGSDEWLYGRAGYLYLLRLIKSDFPFNDQYHQAHSHIQDTADAVIDRILRSPRPWTWHHKAYLGAAHGAIGIMTQIVLSSPARATDLESMLSNLLDLQMPSGNFPSSLPVSGDDRLVQFCHGAPGFLISLRNLRPHFPSLHSCINDAIARARKCVWERGVLTKEPCLCHGVSGNALALASREEFRHFIALTSQKRLAELWGLGGEESVGDESICSLFTGGAGRAWMWALVENEDLPRRCIGYDDV